MSSSSLEGVRLRTIPGGKVSTWLGWVHQSKVSSVPTQGIFITADGAPTSRDLGASCNKVPRLSRNVSVERYSRHGSGGRAVERRTLTNRRDGGSIPPTAM